MGVLAVILGILAVICAVLATFLFGTVGGVVAGVLGAAAIVLGILKRKKAGKGGIAAIVIGGLSIIMTFGLTSAWSNFFTEIHNKAVEYKPEGMWAQVSENTNGGLMGIIRNMPTDDASLNALMDEMNELNKMSEKE